MPTLVLLPEMDGTGELFADLVDSLPDSFEAVTVRYPTDQVLSYSELKPFVQAACPVSKPFVLLAESFSTPLAIQYAATMPPNLCGLLLCAGFATAPVAGWKRWPVLLAAPMLFRFKLPKFAVRQWLLGQSASAEMLAALQIAVSSVRSDVLAARIQAALSCDVRAELAQVSVPVLYIQAAQDRLLSGSCLEAIHRVKPDMCVSVVAGPHLLLQSKPQEAANIIIGFARLANRTV